MTNRQLLVVQEHPAEGREPDDDGDRDGPHSDADVADGLPLAFVPGDLAIALLVFLALIAHGQTPFILKCQAANLA